MERANITIGREKYKSWTKEQHDAQAQLHTEKAMTARIINDPLLALTEADKANFHELMSKEKGSKK